ncbi:MAG: hypothetical protein ACJ73S_14955 [Mycobacteriales bacterium]
MALADATRRDPLTAPAGAGQASTTTRLDPPRHASYRCAAGHEVTEANSTLPEFPLTARNGGTPDGHAGRGDLGAWRPRGVATSGRGDLGAPHRMSDVDAVPVALADPTRRDPLTAPAGAGQASTTTRLDPPRHASYRCAAGHEVTEATPRCRSSLPPRGTATLGVATSGRGDLRAPHHMSDVDAVPVALADPTRPAAICSPRSPRRVGPAPPPSPRTCRCPARLSTVGHLNARDAGLPPVTRRAGRPRAPEHAGGRRPGQRRPEPGREVLYERCPGPLAGALAATWNRRRRSLWRSAESGDWRVTRPAPRPPGRTGSRPRPLPRR